MNSSAPSEPLSPDEWRDAAEKYMDRAYMSLEEAHLMAKNEHWHACVNRLYYACFYGASALLAKHQLSPKTHRGTHAQFSQRLVKEGEFPVHTSGTLPKLSELRHDADYEVFFELEPGEVKPLLEEAEAFVRTCNELPEADEA